MKGIIHHGDSEAQRFTYSYSPANGLVSSVVNTNTGIRCSYGYDIMERVDSISYKKADGSLIRSIEYEYDAAGMIEQKRISNNEQGTWNFEVSYDYDSLDRLVGETRTVGGATSSSTAYSYDLAGNRTVKSAIGNQQSAITYTLGTGNRLASWSASFTNNFVADVRGTSSETIGTDDRWGTLWVSNLTAQVGSRPQVDGTGFVANNIAMQHGTNQFVAAIRDEAGNMGYATNSVVYSVVTNATFLHNTAGCVTNISHTGTGGYSDSMELKWDERYRLEKVSLAEAQSTQSVEYGYDVLGRKISRTAGILPAEVEYYVYNGNQIVADLDGAGNLLRTYVWGIGIDNLLSFTDHTTTNTYYPIKDLQNTVLALMDENGDVIETYDYDAWGRTKVFSASGAELPMSGIGNRYCFQGREIDWDADLYYFRARWYNPETGRWLSKDPIGISGGLNLYAFCDNNPVNFRDPFGLCEDGWNPNWDTFKAGLGGVLKSGVQILLGWGAVLADGPLPFGDLIGAGAIVDGMADMTINGSLMVNGLMGGNSDGIDGPVDLINETVDVITGSDEAGDVTQDIVDQIFEGGGQ